MSNEIKVGIIIPSTNKNLNITTYLKTYFISIFLSSFIKTRCTTYKNYSIFCKIYLIVDRDDIIYSRDEERRKIDQLIDGIEQLDIELIYNDNKTCGWVTQMWNKGFKKAYEENCDFFFQCGDDIEFLDTEWLSTLIHIMITHNNEGITGPFDWGRHKFAVDRGKQTKFILTQSFTSRKHMELFGFYFPEEIKNWYCDDWITIIYMNANKLWTCNKRIINKGGKPRYEPIHVSDDQSSTMKQLCDNLVNKYKTKLKYSLNIKKL